MLWSCITLHQVQYFSLIAESGESSLCYFVFLPANIMISRFALLSAFNKPDSFTFGYFCPSWSGQNQNLQPQKGLASLSHLSGSE